jgi:pyruvate formate lyase activating enzyme
MRISRTPSPTGIVFDIQRASLHDGPGVRTTVFLKGCPLRCVWCHNPESRTLGPQLRFDADKCAGCRSCANACEARVHRFDAAGRHLVAWDKCVLGGACVPACPSDALGIYGGEWSVGEVMRIVLRDRAYYDRSGGGLTLSGGEPTSQIGFAEALLRAAKAAGIHTCVETCGAGPRASYARLLDCCDLFLFDCKASDEKKHRELTGASLGQIRGNLIWLASRGAKILLRCPLVPDINDDEAHLRAVASLSRNLPLEGVELLPYHDGGLAKRRRIGWQEPGVRLAAPGPDRIAHWRSVLAAEGCRGLV